MNRTIFLRQLFICSGLWTLYFLIGLSVGFQTVLVPQLRKANQTVTIEQFSWLASLQYYCGIPWVIVLSVLVNVIGRKKSYIIVCISTLICFTIFYFSTNMTHFLIGQIFCGALASSYFTTSIIILTEYSSTKYRGTFLTFKSATSFWGVLFANAMGTFFHWKYIVVLAIACSLYTLLNVIIWPESPLWLADRGKLVECAAAHRWLKGNDEESEKELDKIIKSQENNRFTKQPYHVQYLFKVICRKQFLKSIFLANLLVCLYSFSGKVVCTVYALDILKKITENESAYSKMLILDAVTVASMYVGVMLSRFLKRRTILLGFSSVGIIFMIIISVYLYLAKLLFIEENKYLSIFLLVTYSIAVSCGPIIMCTSIMGELLPLESRALSMCLMGLSSKIINGTVLKLSPLCFKYIAIHGTFAMFGILSTIFLILIYYYLPETKDKSIHDINANLKGEDERLAKENIKLINHVNFGQ